ncbi:MAG: YceI family protein [Pseudomonadota bacterium]
MRLVNQLVAAPIAGVLAFAAVPALAEPYVLDKSHTVISFQVDHLGFSTVHGVFREIDADITFDPDAVEKTEVKFVVQAASIDTFWAKRDDHLRNADFFDVSNHPEITFVSTSVTPTGGESATVEGELTMLGQTQPVTFEATLNKLGPSPFNPNKQIAGFTVTGEIDRTVFGMSYAAPAVSAVIPIRVDLEMSPASDGS